MYCNPIKCHLAVFIRRVLTCSQSGHGAAQHLYSSRGPLVPGERSEEEVAC